MQEFMDSVKALWDQKRAVEEIKDRLATESREFEKRKRDIIKAMETLELEKQHAPGFGTVYRQKKFSVKVPKDPSSKGELFSWIRSAKGEDVLRNMLSINSQTLNSFYKNELEVAVEEGNVDFRIPGIGSPEVYYTLGMRK